MQLRYSRNFVCDIPKRLILDACRKLIDEWEYDDNTPPEQQTIGIYDIFCHLDKYGHLGAGEELDGLELNIDESWGEDFYTTGSLEKELEGEE